MLTQHLNDNANGYTLRSGGSATAGCGWIGSGPDILRLCG
jgi:hypothetical protein